MIINLKQTEIEAALKAYIANQGINLSQKEIQISFTAGRKESGISAEVTIDEVSIPGFTDAVDDTPKAEVVKLVEAVKESQPVEATEPEVVYNADEPEVAATEDTTNDAEVAATVSTKSLFG